MNIEQVKDVLTEYGRIENNLQGLVASGEKHKKTSNTLIAELFFRRALELEPENTRAKKSLEDIAKNVFVRKQKAKYGTSEVNWEKYKSLLSSKQSNVQRLCGEKLKEFSNLKDIVAGAAKAEAFYRCAVELRLDSNYGKPKLLSNNKEYDGLALYNKGILEKIFNVENGIIFHNISQWCGLSQLEKGEDEFVKWYVKNGSQCAYCKSSILDLLRFYVKNTTKRNRGLSWEVDHRKPDGSFCEENCALVCHYCNNAKSDIFKSSDEFRLIGNAIGQQIAEILTPAA